MGSSCCLFIHIMPGSAIEITDLLRSAGMAELADGLVLDLADTLTGHTEDLTHFLQGVGAAVC